MKDDLRRKLKAANKRRRKKTSEANASAQAASSLGDSKSQNNRGGRSVADAIVDSILAIADRMPINNAAVLSGCRAFLRASDPSEKAAARVTTELRQLADHPPWTLHQLRSAVDDLRKQAEKHCHDDDQTPDSLIVLMRITRAS